MKSQYQRTDTIVIDLDIAKKAFQNAEKTRLFMPEIFLTGNIWLPQTSTYKNLMNAVQTHYSVVTYRHSEIQGISLAYPSNGKDITLYDLYFYGPNKEMLMAHVISQLDHLQSVMLPDHRAEVEIVFPMSIDEEEIKEILVPYLGNTHLLVQTNDKVKEEVLVFETTFGANLKLSRL